MTCHGWVRLCRIRIGYHLGDRNVAMAKRVGLLSFCLMTCFAVIVAAVVLLCRDVITKLFTSDPTVQRLASELMVLVRACVRANVCCMLVRRSRPLDHCCQ